MSARAKDLRIRPFAEADLAAVVTLFTETVREVSARDYRPDQVAAWAPKRPDLERWRSRLQANFTWVAELDGRIIGFAATGPEDHVDLLYTHHQHQRRGVASALYRHLETVARQQGQRRLFTEASVTARPFFESKGFQVVREQEVELRGVRFRNFVMEKLLEPAN